MFDDFRHGKRLRQVLRVLSEHPSESVTQASTSASESQSIDRFWSNKRVQANQILASHRLSVLERVNQQSVVLAIQDTTDFDFTSHPQTSGLGFLHKGTNQGVKVHSCIAVSGVGEPLGLLAQHSWTRSERSGKWQERKQKVTADKESQRWLDTLAAAEQGVQPGVTLVHVGDREADLYDLFVLPRASHSELLIRAAHNRKVRHEFGYLMPTLEQAAIRGQVTLELERNPERAARTAEVTVRALSVTIEVPKDHKQAKQCQPVLLNAILVEEPLPPVKGKPIRWLLLTTLPIETWEQVWQCVRWYRLRWLVERYHYTLKSGCRIEQLQLETKERLLKALATYAIVAWRLMHLTYQARLTPDATCAGLLLPAEWQILRRKFEPKKRAQTPPTLEQVVR